MKIRILLFSLLLSFTAQAQYFTVGDDVQSYSQGLAEAQLFVESELNKGYDFTYSAGERLMYKPTARQLSQGNIGYDFHGIPEVEDYLAQTKGKVAFIVIDDCGAYSHNSIKWIEDLAKDFTGESAELRDQGKHSHHVTGIAVAYEESCDIGIAGILSRDNRAAAVPVKALTYAGSGFYSWIANAGNYAADIIPELKRRGYDHFIVIMSLGGNSSSSAVDAALQRVRQAGGIIYAANGNTGQSPVQYPGRSIYTEGVAALRVTGKRTAERASYSSKGPETSIAGVGSNVFSCQPNGEYAVFNGTSMAAPMVAGVAGNAAAAEPELTAAQIITRVREGCTDLPPTGKDELTGYGYPYAPDVLNPDNSNPDPDPEPEPDPEPDFSSSLVHEIDGMKLEYRRVSSTKYLPIKMDDMLVSVSGKGTTEDVFDMNMDWTKDYFNRVKMVIPDNPTWGHCQTTYWTGQFYEYWSRSDAIGAQVQIARGEDHKGRNCLQSQFDRATEPKINVFTTQKGHVVLSSLTDEGMVMAMIRPQRRGLSRFFLGK